MVTEFYRSQCYNMNETQSEYGLQLLIYLGILFIFNFLLTRLLLSIRLLFISIVWRRSVTSKLVNAENEMQIYCLMPNIYFVQIKHVIKVFFKIISISIIII